MKILRVTAQGLPLFKKDLDICFYTQQRVCEEDKDSLYRLTDNYYLHSACAVSYTHLNKHYRERFHVDAVTAAKDLQELGVNYTQEQLDQIKQAEEQRLRQRRMEREAKERERLAERYELSLIHISSEALRAFANQRC